MQHFLNMADCIFCKIISGAAPANLVYQEDDIIVIHDIHPIAETHLLVIPRKHIDSLNGLIHEEEALASRLLLTVPKVAVLILGENPSYRILSNTGAKSGQTVFHLHLHIISGRPLAYTNTISGFFS